ncbi:MAG: GNAT family N-acetyltransferase [Planctomycetales bacterium]|nr:GNAT family N-acetyltransferase [Planctomycetales bacterium]
MRYPAAAVGGESIQWNLGIAERTMRWDQPVGYAEPAYARSLAAIGQPIALNDCGGWLLERSTGPVDARGNSTRPAPHDACGPYPLFACRDWSRLEADLNSLADRLVAVSLVTDPWGDFDPASLAACFPDLCRKYKDHFVCDLTLSPDRAVSGHHARNARAALRRVDVVWSDRPRDYEYEWLRLYGQLIARHDIQGWAAFDAESLSRQLIVPGMCAAVAKHQGAVVGMTLWLVCRDVAYYHLAAYDPSGYETKASFALFWSAWEFFAARGIRWLSLGAGAGANPSACGLTRFKQGWSTATRPVYLCGRILQRRQYQQLCDDRRVSAGTRFFPAYRSEATS